MRARKLLAVAGLIGALTMAVGCSSEQTSTTTTRTATTAPATAENQPAPPPEATTTTTTSSSNEPDSVLGATFHLVGTIIMLPFRIIGLVV
jgi:hypothetical protein